MEVPKKVMLLGSGPIKVAEAAEFDYSGSQAIKALKEEGIEVVLVNPNVATIQTGDMADRVYLLPLKLDFLERVVEKELPDAIMLGFGGQSALDAGINLWRAGVLDKYGVKVLGTPPEAIDRALNREKFKEALARKGVPMPPSRHVSSEEEALEFAEQAGYPVMIRVSYNLGGRGSFIAYGPEELREKFLRAKKASSIGMALVEKYLGGWKEIEFEVLRDAYGNTVAPVCLENADPMGVHTGESVVVAPCQTLPDWEYQILRTGSMLVAEAVGLVGEGNVQFALGVGGEYYAIEMNPRMSRSSALASKASGYPLAYVAAKLALGYKLHEILNKVTGITCSCFEPSLDYIVVKVPRWDLEKFEGVEQTIGTEMKSIGEVMAIGRNFPEALQKALRMLQKFEGLPLTGDREEALEKLRRRAPYWPVYAAMALASGASVEEVSEASGVDPWFIHSIAEAVRVGKSLRLDPSSIREAKRMGFSDRQIAEVLKLSEDEVRRFRKSSGIRPSFKLIDTLAGEWPSVTNYVYATYGGQEDDIRPRNGVIVLGAGVFRIGVSVEFDWGVVEFSKAAMKYVDNVTIVNYNPETVSTDWDVVDRLYFEELTLERVLDIYERESPMGVVAFLGGQVANDLSKPLEDRGVRLLGTSGKSVEVAENRALFSSLLDRLGIKQPPWVEVRSLREARGFVEEHGLPVMVRPSHVLSGTKMSVVWTEEELEARVRDALTLGTSVVISKFFPGEEAEIDGVGDGESAIGVIIRHVEPAGVHSGDSTMVIPGEGLPSEAMKEIALKLVRELNVRGPFNLQFVIWEDEPYVLELNLRASRSMPFSSKVTGYNLAHLAAKVVFEGSLGVSGFMEPRINHYGVKSPQFSWSQFRGAYPYLGVEMRSTGEVAALDRSYEGALLKSWLSASPNRVPERGVVIGWEGRPEERELFEGVKERLSELGLKYWSVEEDGPEECLKALKEGRADLLMATGYAPDVDFKVRRLAADMNYPLILNAKLAYELAKAFGSEIEVEPVSWYRGREVKLSGAISGN